MTDPDPPPAALDAAELLEPAELAELATELAELATELAPVALELADSVDAALVDAALLDDDELSVLPVFEPQAASAPVAVTAPATEKNRRLVS